MNPVKRLSVAEHKSEKEAEEAIAKWLRTDAKKLVLSIASYEVKRSLYKKVNVPK